LLEVSLDAEPADTLQPIASPAEVLRITQLCRSVLVGERCRHAAVDLVVATQPATDGAGTDARRHIRYGASPRALQALVRAARVRALLAGRAHVDVADLDAVALPVLRHRVLLRLESELDGLDTDGTLASIVDAWRRRL
jgi:MoxR-like ATPase